MAGARGAAGRELVRRLRGGQNRRRGSFSVSRLVAPGVGLLRPAGAVLLVGGLLAVWPPLRDAVRRHPYFAVREVTVRHHGRLTDEAIRAAAGIEPGMSIWDVDCARAETRLGSESWVRTARVRRQLPHRVVIQVREQRPVAVLALDGAPRLYYVAGNGRIFGPVEGADSHDFPYLTGLAETDLGGREAFGPRAIRRALGLLRLAARVPLGAGPVSEIHVERARGLTLLPTRPPLPFELGWGRYDEKLARLPAVLAQWRGREAEITGVSLVFEDEIVVRTRAPKPAAKKTART